MVSAYRASFAARARAVRIRFPLASDASSVETVSLGLARLARMLPAVVCVPAEMTKGLRRGSSLVPALSFN